MNEKLQEAERRLWDLVERTPTGVTMREILDELGGEIGEAELRAAVWTLRADGIVDFDDGKLMATSHAH